MGIEKLNKNSKFAIIAVMKRNLWNKFPQPIFFLAYSLLVQGMLVSTSFADTETPGGDTVSFPIKITNPLRVDNINELLKLVMNLIIQIGIPIIVLIIMWAGFLFVRAQGNPAKVTEAKNTIWYVLIGTAIVLGVGSILSIIELTINALQA